MTNFRSFKGAAKCLEDIDLLRIGSEIRVGEHEFHASMDVEVAGSGFDTTGGPRFSSSRTSSIAAQVARSDTRR